MFRKVLWTILMVVVLAVGVSVPAFAQPIEPPEVNVELHPGESTDIEKSVTTPAIPPVVDICLLEDETGSFADDIANLQTAAPGIYDTIIGSGSDAQFAVAGFRDYPVDPYGFAGDWVYHLLSPMDPTEAAWLAGVAALTAAGGNDPPEAQYDAIVAATGPGVFNDPTLGAQNPCGWRTDSQHVLVVATDAPFHTPDGTHVNDEAATIAALNAESVIVIGLKAPGAGMELDALAAATGGSVQALSSDGANIAAAILAGLAELTTDVWWTAACDAGINVTLDPDVHLDVPGETTVNFLETISVDNATDPGDYSCTVSFFANTYPDAGELIGDELISVRVIPIAVPLDIRPTSCPNPLNVTSMGVLPVAILGTADFDVTTVDPATILLEGVAPLRWSYEDVATPYEPFLGKQGRLDCTTAGPDGFTDLVLHFDTEAVVAALGPVTDGQVVVLQLTADLLDGRAIMGEDVVWIISKP